MTASKPTLTCPDCGGDYPVKCNSKTVPERRYHQCKACGKRGMSQDWQHDSRKKRLPVYATEEERIEARRAAHRRWAKKTYVAKRPVYSDAEKEARRVEAYQRKLALNRESRLRTQEAKLAAQPPKPPREPKPIQVKPKLNNPKSIATRPAKPKLVKAERVPRPSPARSELDPAIVRRRRLEDLRMAKELGIDL